MGGQGRLSEVRIKLVLKGWGDSYLWEELGKLFQGQKLQKVEKSTYVSEEQRDLPDSRTLVLDSEIVKSFLGHSS